MTRSLSHSTPLAYSLGPRGLFFVLPVEKRIKKEEEWGMGLSRVI